MLCNKESVFLKSVETHNNKVEFFFDISDGLKKYFKTDCFFIEYSEDITLDNIPKSILTIPFVASLLPLMWLTDSIMWIPEIDETFYHSLSRIKAAYQEIYDYYPLKGSLIPAYIIKNNLSPQRESLCLFSGGVDAHTTYLRHSNENPLLFNVQGWYENSTRELNAVAEKDLNDILGFSNAQNRDFSFAKSNFANIVDASVFSKTIKKRLKDSWWHGFQHSMAFISIAIVACYFYGIKNIYIASSFALGDKGRCASYPTTDSEFAFAKIGTVVHDGFELSRQDKVQIIVEHQRKTGKPYPLKVCTFEEENCLICEKCVRTMLAIIAENGDLNNFGFNITTPLYSHFDEAFNEQNIVFFNVNGESKKHWPYIKKRMLKNYDLIKEKQVVDWFLNYDFNKARKKALNNYYRKNFFKIIKRKLTK